MKVSVWDTYVQRKDGNIMHFDILVPNNITDEEIIINFGKLYLKSKPFETGKLTSSECNFCHVEQATDDIVKNIEKLGFHIIEMEHCN
ncbi:DUF2024 family protein [Formosa maritima]|uniref:DUF2024 family protein n=1 Tax=Formosa maritima TaxID=2592046 RepID=A0A5D0GBG7_9FLAO|nr:DUF2024 family protein [Formosa maritima]TYA56328.1 DUF2024 family protein [Formosa maritima]